MIKFNVLDWLTGEIKFTADIDCGDDAPNEIKLGLALKWGVANKADFYRARLDRARLDGARLVGARLDGASLVGASLDGASLDGASLDGASLDGASLDGASLVGASLDGASLDGASLDGASLDGASLDGASLDGASLRSIRTDFFDILLRAQAEVPALLEALRAGNIDGSTYSGECACLCGTIANARHVDCDTLDFVDASRPAERWFLGIKPGDTPETNQIARITEEWILEFMGITGIRAGSLETDSANG